MNNQIASSAALVLLVATSSCLVSCQFLPQSHLGRLVQSITSPLVLSSGGYSGAEQGGSDGSDAYGEPSGYYGSSEAGQSGERAQPAAGSQQAAYQQQQRPVSQRLQEQHKMQQAGALQQAPSQQRGVPQHFYGQNQAAGSDDEHDQGQAQPSNNKHTQDYQMGAYLGPSMDDKEINGAFNSNDERDEDDGPASYDGPPSSGSGRGRAAASSNAYAGGSNYRGQGYGAPGAAGPGGYQGAGYDEDGADEDDAPAHAPRQGRQGQRFRSGLSQAASQYRQQGYDGQGGASGPMMAAANGFAGFGFGTGPADLSGLMSGLGGSGDPGYQVYNGDGSYPGASYYQQQQLQPGQGAQMQRGGAGRGQAASMNNGYYNQNNNAQGNSPNGREQANADNDEHDNDGDED